MMKYVILGVATIGSGCATGPCDRALHSRGLVISVENIEASSTYRVEVDADGTLLDVTFTVDADHRIACTDSCEATASSFEIGPEFGFDPSGDMLDSIRFAVHHVDDGDRGPRDLTLRIYRDTQLAYERQTRPAYAKSEPSGEGCGEVAFALVSAPLSQ